MSQNTLKHLHVKKRMSFNEQFKVKWNEQHRKSIGYYEPIPNLKPLFKEGKMNEIKTKFQWKINLDCRICNAEMVPCTIVFFDSNDKLTPSTVCEPCFNQINNICLVKILSYCFTTIDFDESFSIIREFKKDNEIINYTYNCLKNGIEHRIRYVSKNTYKNIHIIGE